MTTETDQNSHESSKDGELELETERSTAPMSDFSVRDAAFGFVVMVIGVALVFGIPVAFF